MSVRKTKTGKKPFVADCRAIGLGQRRFRTKEEAQKYHDEKMRLFGTASAAQVQFDVLFKDYAARWLTAMPDWKPNTRAIYETATRVHLVKEFGDCRIRELTTPAILRWAEKLRGQKKPGTVRLYLGVLRLICRRAVVEGLLVANPVAGVLGELGLRANALRVADGEEEAGKALTPEQLGAFMASAQRVAPSFAPLWRVQVGCGLRPGEANGLHVADVVDDSGAVRDELSVRRTVTRDGKQVGAPKTANAYRDIEISPDLHAFLVSYVKTAKLRFTPNAPLFPAATRDGAPYPGASLVGRMFRKVLKDARLPAHLSPHALRHTFATLHLIAGADVYWLARQLGHKDIRMTTAIYGSWLKPRRPEQLTRFDALLASALATPAKGGEAAA